MSKNRDQVATGMRALLGGANLRTEAPPSAKLGDSRSTSTTPISEISHPRQDAEQPAPARAPTPAIPVNVAVVETAPLGMAASDAHAVVDERAVESTAPLEASSHDLAVRLPEPSGEGRATSTDRAEVPDKQHAHQSWPPRSGDEKPEGMTTRVSVGTIHHPAFRERDGQLTRKFGIVLPIDLKDRIDLHCLKHRRRPNEFIEAMLEAAMERLEREERAR